jgi:hypothetical protein
MATSAIKPHAGSVATRAIISKFVVAAAFTAPPPSLRDGWTRDERDKFIATAETWRLNIMNTLGDLRGALTPWEEEYFAASAATMSLQQQIDGLWRIESLQVLLWALNIISDLPPYDAQASSELLNLYPDASAEASIKSAWLRPAAAIENQRDIAEIWHWRSRTRQLIERGDAFPASPELRAKGFNSYDDIVRGAAMGAAQNGVTTLIDGDFSAKGKAYRDLTDEEWSEVRSIAMERHFALNWLCGYAPSNRWDETPTDT